MDALRIIIADDHPLFRKGLAEVLRAEPGIELAGECGDGEAALALIQRHRPAIAVLDEDMPRLRGLDVAEQVRLDRLPTAIVLLTMHAEGELLRKALDRGVHGYILKESAVGDIIVCLRLVAEGRTYVSPTAAHLLRGDRESAGSTSRISGAPAGIDRLSPAEREVLRQIALSATTREIASQLGITPKTVENHRYHICTKLGLSGANALLHFALTHRGILA